MDGKKSPGDDGLNIDIIQLVANSDHLPLLTQLFNQCLKFSIFPDIWKCARIRILPKPGKDDYSDIRSFRPIGQLFNTMGSVLEKLLIQRIEYDLRSRNQLSSSQYGFTKQRSTVDALSDAIAVVKDALHNAKHEVVAISLDIKGAFDHAQFSIILAALAKRQLKHNLYRMIKDYLTNRMAPPRTKSRATYSVLHNYGRDCNANRRILLHRCTRRNRKNVFDFSHLGRHTIK